MAEKPKKGEESTGNEIARISWSGGKSKNEKLGRGIYVSPKSTVSIDEGRVEYNFPNGDCSVIVPIDDDNVAFLLMDKRALDALRKKES